MDKQQSGGGSRKKALLWACVITEHDGSITAVIRHQTKGASRAGQRGRGGGGRMVLVTPALSQGLLMKCQPPSTEREVNMTTDSSLTQRP